MNCGPLFFFELIYFDIFFSCINVFPIYFLFEATDKVLEKIEDNVIFLLYPFAYNTHPLI